MQLTLLTIVLLLLASLAYRLGRNRSLAIVDAPRHLHSLPNYYGYYVALWCGLPALAIVLGWVIFEPYLLRTLVVAALPPEAASLSPEQVGLLMNDVRNLAIGQSATTTSLAVDAAQHYRSLRATGFAAIAVVALAAAITGLALALRNIHAELRARNQVERVVKVFLIASSTLAVFTTIGIVLSLLAEAARFFHFVSPFEFLFGLHWSPQMAMRSDQVGSSGGFGAVPLFTGTLLISGIAMIIAVPLGLMSAIYMSEYAPLKFRAFAKPLLEVLAGIPTVVYGFFAVLTMAPFIRSVGQSLGLEVAAESALSAGLVMGVMIIPFVSSLSDDVITAVPQALRHGSYGLGATKSETIRQVVIPAALPGIVGGVLLAISRAIGETMIVVMAAGLSANLTANPFASVTTVTVQVVSLLVGDSEFDSPKTLAAFALGLLLFCVTLALNVVALKVVRKYREKYD